jgi:hypothetical protein
VGGLPPSPPPLLPPEPFRIFGPSALLFTDSPASSVGPLLYCMGGVEEGVLCGVCVSVCVGVCVSTNRTGPSVSPPLYVCRERRLFRVT